MSDTIEVVYLLKSSVPDIVINEKNAGNDSKNLVQQIHFGDGVLSLARMLNKQGNQTNVSVLQIKNTNFFKGAASKHKRIFEFIIFGRLNTCNCHYSIIQTVGAYAHIIVVCAKGRKAAHA